MTTTTERGADLIRAAYRRMRNLEAVLMDAPPEASWAAYRGALEAYERSQRLYGWLLGRYEVR